jgi:hypothetical protein
VRIGRVEIRNFRCHRELVIELEPLTILIGANGAGKSSVLDALQFFFDPKTLRSGDAHGNDPDTEVAVRVTLRELGAADRAAFRLPEEVATIEFVRTSTQGRSEFRTPALRASIFDHVRAETAALARRTAYSRLSEARPELGLPGGLTRADQVDAAMMSWERTHPGECTTSLADASSTLGANADDSLSARLRYFRIAAVRDASQEAREGRGTLLTRLLLTIAVQRGAAGEVAREIEARFQREFTNRVEPAHRESVKSLADAMTRELRGYVDDAVIELFAASDPVRLPEPSISVRAGESGEVTNLDRQGHGFQRSFLMAALQLLATAEASEEGAPSIFLAADEPELYQHPPRARHVGAVLASIGDRADTHVQVAYSTHSPYLIDPRRFERLRVLRRMPGGVRTIAAATAVDVATRLPAIDAAEITWRIGRTMDVGFNETFFASAVLLAEGLSDTAVIRGTAERMNVDLDALGIVLLEGSKTLIPIRWAILDSLGIKTFILFDADKDASPGTPPPRDRIPLNRELQRLAGVAQPADFPAQGVHERFACFGGRLESYLDSIRPGTTKRISELAPKIGATEAYRQAAFDERFELFERVVERLVEIARPRVASGSAESASSAGAY